MFKSCSKSFTDELKCEPTVKVKNVQPLHRVAEVQPRLRVSCGGEAELFTELQVNNPS